MNATTEINKAYSILSQLQFNFTYQVCSSIFPTDTDHFWEKWVRCNYNIISFINLLDVLNKQKVLFWVERNYK